MKTLVIVTSAVESRFGIYTADQRLTMTLDTMRNLRARIPDVKIVVNEVSGNGISKAREDALVEHCDIFLDFTTNHEVNWIYNNSAWYNNWDVVKNLTELTTFPLSLHTLLDAQELDGIDRVFKMSGRYQLNEKFNLDLYRTDAAKDKIVIGRRCASQFPYEVTLLREQYMARLLSWPASMQKDMANYYVTARDYMRARMKAGGYADIEHCLFYALPPERVLEVDEVGVFGTIAPNGQPIVN